MPIVSSPCGCALLWVSSLPTSPRWKRPRLSLLFVKAYKSRLFYPPKTLQSRLAIPTVDFIVSPFIFWLLRWTNIQSSINNSTRSLTKMTAIANFGQQHAGLAQSEANLQQQQNALESIVVRHAFCTNGFLANRTSGRQRLR